jgi:hypothetical protein
MGNIGKSKEMPSSPANCPIISRLRQTLTGDTPIHPKQILHRKNIRVLFLWANLWSVSRAAGRVTGLQQSTLEKRMPDSL